MYLPLAISIGLVGSLHCLGMCGPLLAAVQPKNRRWEQQLLHHGGRLLVYMIMGIVAGALGKSIDLMGYQQPFSMILGIVLVASVVALPMVRSLKRVEARIGQWSIKLSGWIHRSGMSARGVQFAMGIANGILPCGLVYLGVAGAANTYTPWDGGLFMIGFGLGTLPALLLVAYLAGSITPRLRTRVRTLIPIGVFIMGSLLIVRGMNLGIPYLSPQTAIEANQVVDCH